nr:Wzz/FepE/Etk N-terminal domain-containing protein [Klebsiella pneumoniae]
MAISLVENGKKKEGFIDFTPYFNKIKHKLVWCLAVVIVAAVASFILTRFMSSSYTATATVLFKAQSQDISPCRGWKTTTPRAAIITRPSTH